MSKLLRSLNFKSYSSEFQYPIKNLNQSDELTEIDSFRNKYTVTGFDFATAWESKQYFKWLVKEHPLHDVFMDFYETRENEIVVDYGCGPGNDLFRLLVVNNAKKVVGLDVSQKALKMAT